MPFELDVWKNAITLLPFLEMLIAPNDGAASIPYQPVEFVGAVLVVIKMS